MERNVISSLRKWKRDKGKKPLLLEGARQTGKTWLMKKFGKLCYKNFVYFNFDDNKKLWAVFEQDLNSKRIIRELELHSGQKIIPGETLIIFDEIQECNRALVSLKYFCENAPEYHIVSAGSLLGVAIHKGNSFPVGKVNTIKLYPMSFAEFLQATGETRLEEIVREKRFDMLHVLSGVLEEKLKYYYFTGGMPAAVQSFIETGDLQKVRKIQKDILSDYEQDFSKHINAPDIPKVGAVWKSIPLQLAKENKQFVYREIKHGARAAQFEFAFYWLERVGLIHKVHKVETPNMPLMAYQKEAFKVFMLDVGLLSAQVGLTVENLANPNAEVFNHFKGALTEQFVLQELKTIEESPVICYWANDNKKGVAEVDFLLQYNGEIIPLEAKASINLKAKSLKAYMDYFKPKTAIRTSLANYKRHDTLLDIPLYALAGCIGINL